MNTTDEIDEYIQRFAKSNQLTIEQAKQHLIVKYYINNKTRERDEGQGQTITCTGGNA